ncbi:Dynein assembly factor 1, axonemal [Tetrabaena socialis]|uniref:Dynein assembly factor 1, axonemal n=1 Tax=Tetrabaena socialis TaxID=47790 RepID=A0A2J7ZSZ0_9CHLO|nr:Dynein assembly factor 1, axonemal [Tetrabaena socialis]|eukprot:PNH03385.1 Dynein assembly factor 1, axonemal [Tetrabaena socialis]
MDEHGARLMSPRVVARVCRSRGHFATPACNTTLYLQDLRFRRIENLQEFVACRVLHLSSNCLPRIEGLEHMRGLQVLDLSSNAELAGREVLDALCGLAGLRVLYVMKTPLHRIPNLRRILVSALPCLTYLDAAPVDECDRRGCEAWLLGGVAAEKAARLAYRAERRLAQKRSTVTFAVERARRRALREMGLAGNDAASLALALEDTDDIVRRRLGPVAAAAAVTAAAAGTALYGSAAAAAAAVHHGTTLASEQVDELPLARYTASVAKAALRHEGGEEGDEEGGGEDVGAEEGGDGAQGGVGAHCLERWGPGTDGLHDLAAGARGEPGLEAAAGRAAPLPGPLVPPVQLKAGVGRGAPAAPAEAAEALAAAGRSLPLSAEVEVEVGVGAEVGARALGGDVEAAAPEVVARPLNAEEAPEAGARTAQPGEGQQAAATAAPVAEVPDVERVAAESQLGAGGLAAGPAGVAAAVVLEAVGAGGLGAEPVAEAPGTAGPAAATLAEAPGVARPAAAPVDDGPTTAGPAAAAPMVEALQAAGEAAAQAGRRRVPWHVTGLPECVVCSELFVEEEEVVLLPCHHFFHDRRVGG